MSEIFKSHQEITEKDFVELWKKALFIFDTNTLLDIYRLPESAKTDFLNILSDKKIKDRVWLPFQVILEFTQNRLDVIGDQKGKFSAVQSIINSGIEDLENSHQNLRDKINKLQLKKRHSVIDPDKFINDDLFKESKEKLQKFLNELKELDTQQPDVNDKDETKKIILEIFENKIGSSFNLSELEEIYKEGEIRYKEEIPPGFKDKDKLGFYLFEDKKYIRKFGDLIAWKEIIKKAVEDKLEYIIFVSNDGKEDWWSFKRGRTLGPRYELLNEIYFKATDLKVFHMYDSYNFMRYSKENLEIEVKEQSMIETKDLIELHQKNSLAKINSNVMNFKELLKELSTHLGVRVRFSQGFESTPILTIPKDIISHIFMEILMNVKQHSDDKIVTIRMKNEGDFFVIKFKNQISTSNEESEQNSRKNGLKYIYQLITPYGFADHLVIDNMFQVKLYIDTKFLSLNLFS